VVVYLRDKDNLENSFAFQLNFNKTFNTLPEHPKLTEVQSQITKGFAKNAADELIVLFKQRAVEAKAYGEKNPISYLEFEPGRYFNYIELLPRNKEMLDFNYEDNQYFAEDSYDIDPRNDNKCLQLSFFKFQLDSADQAPVEIQQEKVKPNEPCPCGSGKKYKKCCALMLN